MCVGTHKPGDLFSGSSLLVLGIPCLHLIHWTRITDGKPFPLHSIWLYGDCPHLWLCGKCFNPGAISPTPSLFP